MRSSSYQLPQTRSSTPPTWAKASPPTVCRYKIWMMLLLAPPDGMQTSTAQILVHRRQLQEGLTMRMQWGHRVKIAQRVPHNCRLCHKKWSRIYQIRAWTSHSSTVHKGRTRLRILLEEHSTSQIPELTDLKVAKKTKHSNNTSLSNTPRINLVLSKII